MSSSVEKEEVILDLDIVKEEYVIQEDLEVEFEDQDSFSSNSLTCGICSKTFKDEKSLRMHGKCQDDPKFECTNCGQRFAIKTNLKFHILKVHQGLTELEISGQVFRCEICGKDFPSKRSLTWHRYNHKKLKKYECPECGGIFKTKKMLQDHLQTTHNIHPQPHKEASPEDVKEFTFSCPKCPKTFSARNNLTIHMKVHRFHDSLTCQTCGKTSKNRRTLLAHLKTHEDPRYECKECGKKYTSSQGVRIHTLKVHYGLSEVDIFGQERMKKPQRVSCDICGRELADKKTLKKHQSCHSSVRDFECPECHNRYKRSSALRHHIRTIHIAERPHACSACGKTFKTRYALKVHLMTHEERTANQIPCKICGKEVRKDCMRHHIKVHNAKNLECEKCGMKYRTKRNIMYHIMRIHLGMSVNEITGKTITCAECGKEFFNMDQLRRHMLSHSTTRDFKCPICPRAFKSSADCGYHVGNFHSTQRTPCGVCGKTFKNPGSLGKHLRRKCEKNYGKVVSDKGPKVPSTATVVSPQFNSVISIKVEQD